MRIGIVSNVSGNIFALNSCEEWFCALQADVRICLGRIVGMYPFVDETVDFLSTRGFRTLKETVDESFVSHCRGAHNYEIGAMYLQADALKFAGKRVSRRSLEFIQDLPTQLSVSGVRFDAGLLTSLGPITRPPEAMAAFKSCTESIVFHTADVEAAAWGEDLIRRPIVTGNVSVSREQKWLVSTGGIGCRYASSRIPVALAYDTDLSQLQVHSPVCNAPAIFESLRREGYPESALRYLECNEYASWRSSDGN